MDFSPYIAALFAFLLLTTSLYIAITKNLFYASLSLLCSLLCVAAIYVLLQAEFLAVTQLMVYVGGVVILLLFGIMLTGRTTDGNWLPSLSRNTTAGAILAITCFLLLCIGITADFSTSFPANATTDTGTLKYIGFLLLTEYMLPLEIVALLLLLVLAAAAYMATKHPENE